MMVDEFWPPKTVAQCREALGAREELAFGQVDLDRLGSELASHGPELADQYLTPQEGERFQQFRFAKRQVEWLGGRLAVKAAAARLLDGRSGLQGSDIWQQWQIDNLENGRPIICSGRSRPEISISHSGNRAVAMAAGSSRCGLDIQHFTPTITKVEERFAHPEEVRLWAEHLSPKKMTREEFLTLLWSAKEALRKAVDLAPLAGFLELRLTSLQLREHGFVVCGFTCPRFKGRAGLSTFSTVGAAAGPACSVALLRHPEGLEDDA